MQPTARRRVAVQSASVLEPKLRAFRGDLTIADAAARGGLALRDAEAALYHLSSEYHGHLKATSDGLLLFSFPQGLQKKQESWLTRAGKALWKGVVGVGRFVIRAWVSVVLVGYAAVLLAILIALALKDDSDNVGDALGLVLRIVFEALFWTFHPFSPMRWEREPAWARKKMRGRFAGAQKIPFYEKVNRFVFGPPEPKVNLEARERQLVAEIRRLDGRVGAGDLMRVLGGTREAAEAELCRLVLDYEGEIEVSEEGAVIYVFKALRKTADTSVQHANAPQPIWKFREAAPKLTGNGAGTNVVLGAINGFNLVASGVVLANGLTVERIVQLLTERAGQMAGEVAAEGAATAVAGGTPLLFGAIPFAFSAALFALPAARALRRGAQERKVKRENSRRTLLAAVVGEGAETPEVLTANELRRAWIDGGAAMPSDAELTEEVRRIGGEPDVSEEGKLVFRFADLSREARALAEERKGASVGERQVGEVVFSSLPAADES